MKHGRRRKKAALTDLFSLLPVAVGAGDFESPGLFGSNLGHVLDQYWRTAGSG